MFSKKYAVYKVMTHPLKYEVKRRFNDFMWLRNMLVRDYPTCIVFLRFKIRYLLWQINRRDI